MKVAVFGLGYVGLPVASLAARRGHDVVGVDTNPEKVLKTSALFTAPDKDGPVADTGRGSFTFTSDGAAALVGADVVVICVPTPLTGSMQPDLRALEDASRTIAVYMESDVLVSVESTVAPFTCRELVRPLLEESGMRCERDFYVVHCPERIDPGNAVWPLEKIPRVIGGLSAAGLARGASFYESLIDAPVVQLSSIESAEAAKMVENAFRDVNIAFVNEIAMAFDQMGINVMEVIQAASTKPFGFMPHYPGCGVGGHCIPVDPCYLMDKAKARGFEHRFLNLAREINNYMPEYTVGKVFEAMNEAGRTIKGGKITVLGVAYKPDVPDIRHSPAFRIIDLQKERGAAVRVYDPYFPEYSNFPRLEEALYCDCLVLVTAHAEFKTIDLSNLEKYGVVAVVDGRNVFDRTRLAGHKIVYRGIGVR